MTHNNATANEPKKPSTLEDLKKFSFELSKEGVWSYHRVDGKSFFTHFPSKDSREKRGKYYRHNNVFAFIDTDGRFFICPFFNGIMDCLHGSENFFVPFSDGSRPDRGRDSQRYLEWKKLVDITHKWNEEHYEKELANVRAEIRERCYWAGNVPKEVLELEQCMEILPGGIKVISVRDPEPTVITPLWFKSHLDSSFDSIFSELGVYGANGGVLQINSNDGRTFIIKGYNNWVEDKLIANGYEKKRIHVNFSNNEKIVGVSG